jgi:hypothetical protein
MVEKITQSGKLYLAGFMRSNRSIVRTIPAPGNMLRKQDMRVSRRS